MEESRSKKHSEAAQSYHHSISSPPFLLLFSFKQQNLCVSCQLIRKRACTSEKSKLCHQQWQASWWWLLILALASLISFKIAMLFPAVLHSLTEFAADPSIHLTHASSFCVVFVCSRPWLRRGWSWRSRRRCPLVAPRRLLLDLGLLQRGTTAGARARLRSSASRTRPTGRWPSASAATASSRRRTSSPCSATPRSRSSSSPAAAASTSTPTTGLICSFQFCASQASISVYC